LKDKEKKMVELVEWIKLHKKNEGKEEKIKRDYPSKEYKKSIAQHESDYEAMEKLMFEQKKSFWDQI